METSICDDSFFLSEPNARLFLFRKIGPDSLIQNTTVGSELGWL